MIWWRCRSAAARSSCLARSWRCIALIVLGRVVYLNWSGGAYYAARADDNASQSQATPAPRGIIYDAEGDPLVENKAVFDAVLNAHLFISDPSQGRVPRLPKRKASSAFRRPRCGRCSIKAKPRIFPRRSRSRRISSQSQLVNIQALGSSTIEIQSDFERYYPDGPVFSSVVGYVGRVSQSDLASDPKLTADDFVGKTGIEEEYDTALQGTPGVSIKFTDAYGKVLGEEQQSASDHRRIGAPHDRRRLCRRKCTMPFSRSSRCSDARWAWGSRSIRRRAPCSRSSICRDTTTTRS